MASLDLDCSLGISLVCSYSWFCLLSASGEGLLLPSPQFCVGKNSFPEKKNVRCLLRNKRISSSMFFLKYSLWKTSPFSQLLNKRQKGSFYYIKVAQPTHSFEHLKITWPHASPFYSILLTTTVAPVSTLTTLSFLLVKAWLVPSAPKTLHVLRAGLVQEKGSLATGCVERALVWEPDRSASGSSLWHFSSCVTLRRLPKLSGVSLSQKYPILLLLLFLFAF